MTKRKGFSLEEREHIIEKTNFKCAHCGRTLDKYTMTVEHIMPVSRGGTNDEYNITALCDECNNLKSNWTFSGLEWYKYIDNKYLDAYRKEYRKQLKTMQSSTLFKVTSSIYKFIPENGIMQLANMARSKKHKKLPIKNFIVLLKLEPAYTGDANEILKFIRKMHEKDLKYSNGRIGVANSHVYESASEIAETIKTGEVYVLRNRAMDLCGALMFEKVYDIEQKCPQIHNIATIANRDTEYVLTYCEVTPYANRVWFNMLSAAISNMVTQGHYPLFANILTTYCTHTDKMVKLPYRLKNKEVVLETFTLDGLRRHFNEIYSDMKDYSKSEYDDVTVDDIVAYVLDFKDEIDKEKYEFIDMNVSELGINNFVFGDRI